MSQHCEHLILSNDTALDDDGWALIAPFGEHPKTRIIRGGIEQKFLQVLDNEAADNLLSKENSLFRRIKRAIVGIPVYKGHPDLADYSPETMSNHQKKAAIGVVDKVRKAARGIEAHFSLLPAGADAVAHEDCKYPSALWLVRPDGRRGDYIVAKPFQLLSVGLTAHPNISGVESLANAGGAGPEQEPEPPMKLIAGWLIANGVALANSDAPTESEVLNGLKSLFTSKAGEVTTLANEKSTAAGKITAIENENATLASQVTALSNENSAIQAQHSALQKSRASAIVDLAITRGKLAVADRDANITTLANCAGEAAFKVASESLLGKARVVKLAGADTQSGKILSNEGATGETDPRDQYATAIAEHLKQNPEHGPIQAHNAVMKKFPTLADKLKARGETANKQ